MSKRLFVGGLPFSMTDQDLRELFSQFGQVESASVIIDRFSGRSKGFGFVEMSAEDADKAIAALNNSELEGRKIAVNEARPREERTPSYGGGGQRSGGYNSDRRGGGGGGRGFQSRR